MGEPYTLSILVADGTPDGVCIIQRRNWPGVGVKFPRERLAELATLADELKDRTGVYILVGPDDEGSGLQKVYVSEGDVLARLQQHDAKRDWWEWAIAFVSASDRLTASETLWLEQSLIAKAVAARTAVLDNDVRNQSRAILPRTDAAEMAAFLRQMLSIVPLFGITAFEPPPTGEIRGVVDPSVPQPGVVADGGGPDTLIVFSNDESAFKKVWLRERIWWPVRVARARLSKIKHVAIYRGAPVAAITHVGDVKRFVPLSGEAGYRVELAGEPRAIPPIRAGKRPTQVPRGTKYAALAALEKARELADVLPLKGASEGSSGTAGRAGKGP